VVYTYIYIYTYMSAPSLMVALSQLRKKQAVRCTISVQFVSYQRVPESYYRRVNNLFFTLRIATCLSYIKWSQKNPKTKLLI